MIRVATTEDAATITALVNSAFRGESSRAGWTTEEHLLGGQRVDEAGIREIVAAADKVILVHERDHEMIACVQLERTGDACYLGMLTVKPVLQGSGLGTKLLEAAEQWAHANWGSTSVHMTVVIQRPELFTWYERRGYHRTGRRKPFPYGDERFGLPQRDDLAFEVLEKKIGHNR